MASMDRSDLPSRMIACDACVMQHTAVCGDCLVTYFVDRDEPRTPLALDEHEEEVVRLLSRAGLVPALRHRLAG
jgi:hypothetical protein